MKVYKRAFVIGKFLPPHAGHRALIDLASSFAQHVVVAVEQQKNEAIPVAHRAQIVRSFAPYNVSVKELLGQHPQSPSESNNEKEFWEHWTKTIKSIVSDVDVIVSSDDYGAKLASDLGVDWIKCDRAVFPTSATKIKDNLWECFGDLVDGSQTHLARRVSVLGAESTGKTTLAKNLSEYFDFSFVPEYAEHHIKTHPSDPRDKKFFQSMLAGQSGYRAAFGRGKKVVVEDSSAVTTALYAHQAGLPELARQILKQATEAPPHMVIVSKLTGADFVKDTHRAQNTDLLKNYEDMLLEWLEKRGWPYVSVSGTWDQRFEQAKDHVKSFAEYWQGASWDDWTTQSIPLKYGHEKKTSKKLAG